MNRQFVFGAVCGASAALAISLKLFDTVLPNKDNELSTGKQISNNASKLVPPPPESSITERHLELAKYGLPQTHSLRLKTNYISSSSLLHRSPEWVLEHLNASNMNGPVERTGLAFLVDRDLESHFRASNQDYFRSGYSRGHMAPAGNNKQSMEAMRDTFLLNSNIVPQDLDMNIYYWNRLEKFCKDLVHHFDNVYIVSGPLYLTASDDVRQDTTDETTSAVQTINSDKRTIGVIGKSQVSVPTHLFKAILAEKRATIDAYDDDSYSSNDNAYYTAAFILPNRPIDGQLPIESFKVEMEQLESLGGLKLFPTLLHPNHEEDNIRPIIDVVPVDSETTDLTLNEDKPSLTQLASYKPAVKLNDLCKELGGCYLMDEYRHKIMQLTRSLKSARSVWYAEKAMKELEKLKKQGHELDAEIEDIYELKISEFKSANEKTAADEATSNDSDKAANTDNTADSNK